MRQPTLSSRVKALEERYGIGLFDRVDRGVVLTELGTRPHRMTHRLYNLDREAEEILSVAPKLGAGRIRVGPGRLPPLVPVVAESNRRYPEPGLSVDISDAGRVPRDLRKPGIGVAVPARADPDPRLRALPFSETALEIRGIHYPPGRSEAASNHSGASGGGRSDDLSAATRYP